MELNPHIPKPDPPKEEEKVEEKKEEAEDKKEDTEDKKEEDKEKVSVDIPTRFCRSLIRTFNFINWFSNGFLL